MGNLELKPCPFCGGEAIKGVACHVHEDYAFRVECRECKIVTPFYATEAEAIEAWNRRAERTAKVRSLEKRSETVMGWEGICTSCGAYTIHEMNYCHNCGAKLDWSEL